MLDTLKNKIRLAIKSRKEYTSGEMQEFQKYRLSVCKGCPFNSDNLEHKSPWNYIQILANDFLNLLFNIPFTNRAVCTLCSCNLYHKSSQIDPENVCQKGYWKI